MIGLRQWLESQGLAQYAEVFAENDIDLDVLSVLAEADLKKLGLSLGHRRKLLHALDAQRAAARQSAASVPATPAAPTEATDAERRQITVLFCDLVESTELANVLDPEDASALMRRYQDACASAVASFEGYVAKFVGDGVIAYFGYPQAREDAAENAVRCALALLAAVGQINRPDGRACQVRIGIATGVVVVGELIGTGTARERAVVGDAPNLAARLQALARPGAIVIGGRTRGLLGERFAYESLGEHKLKGFPALTETWRVLREVTAETRFAATRDARQGLFVGRNEESSLLLDRWRRAAQGQGQFVFISGEAGVGKSRLADVFSDRIAGERCHRVTCQCSPYHTNSALYPVIRHLERAAGFAPADGDAKKLDKLEAMLRGSGTGTASRVSLVADLLSLPTTRYPRLELSPPQRKAATLAALVDLLTGLARDAPVLLLLEDAHWIDPTTTELWARLIDSASGSRLLALVTARPEFASPWKERSSAYSLELSRLGDAEAADLAAATAAPHVLDAAVVNDIVAKSDGIPLYVEELTKAVVGTGTPKHATVPATLQDSLMARLDRLGPAKEIAQVAAVIGRDFSQPLLTALASQSALQLQGGMDGLLDAGLVYRRGQNGASSYSFKHALVRDVAYNSLLRARRQQLHERIGEVLLKNFAPLAESEPELIAHHFHHAALWDAACTYRERAGDRALARSSYMECVAHYSEALAEAAQIVQPSERRRRELALLLKLGPPITIVKGTQSSEAEDVYRRAREHAIALEDEPALFKGTWGLWYNAVNDRLASARSYSEELIMLGRKSNDDDLLLEAFHCRWGTGQLSGDTQTALDASSEGIGRYDRAKHAWMGPVFGGHDPGVCAYGVHATALALLGRCAESAQFRQQSIDLAETLGQVNNRAHALLWVACAAQIASEYTELIHCCDAAIALADKYGLPPVHAHASFLRGSALALLSDLEGGVAAMEAEFARAAAVAPFMRFYAGLLADGQQRLGRAQAALEVIRRALETVAEPGVGFFVSELHRVKGMCLLRHGSADEAMSSLRTAVEIARTQRATVLEVRAAISLARASIAQSRPSEDVHALSELCASLPSTFDAPELREAKELLSMTC